MIAEPEGPSFITRTVGRRRYADDASVSHDPIQTASCDPSLPSSWGSKGLRAFARLIFALRISMSKA
jgi:hypothetical protein